MRVLVAIFTCLLLLSGTLGFATIINIPDDYLRIQWGIDVSSDGDTVLVQPDIYVENINFNGHNVVLASLFFTTGDTTYIAGTVIDGDRDGSVITFESGEDSSAQVVGLTIRNGYGRGDYPYFCGGGITCWDDSNPRIESNLIHHNRVYWAGGGISCCYSSPTITGNRISGNEGGDNGGGIFCICSDVIVVENSIDGNWGYDGGGICCCGQSNPTIGMNSILRNSSASRGGGIFCSGSCNPTIESNIISGNFGGTFPGVGGGIYVGDSQPTIRNNIIGGNAASSGGGIHCRESDPLVINNTVTGNVANGWEPDYGYGGGICCQYGSSPIVINSILWDDTAMIEGDEIYVDSTSSVVVTYCNVKDTLWPGPGNISIDPLFRDPSNGDYHLQSITNPTAAAPGILPA